MTAGTEKENPNMGAIWWTVGISSCPGQSLSYGVTETNVASGRGQWFFSPFGNVAGTQSGYLFYGLSLASTYRVAVTVKNSTTGKVVAIAQRQVSTPASASPGA